MCCGMIYKSLCDKVVAQHLVFRRIVAIVYLIMFSAVIFGASEQKM